MITDGEEEEDTSSMNRTPEENKNPEIKKSTGSPSKVVMKREKSVSFTPPPALSPAYSIHEDMEEEEEMKVEVEDHEMTSPSTSTSKKKGSVSPRKTSPMKSPKKMSSPVKSPMSPKSPKSPKMKEEVKEVKEEEVVVKQKPTYKKKPKKTEKDKDAVPFIDPNAPKRNRSAYVHFIISRRANYSKAVMSQRDINIALAADWQKLNQEERVPFVKKAEEEKEKYLELMEEYKKTDQHKEFQKARSKFVSSQSSTSAKNRKRKATSDDEDDVIQMSFPKPAAFCPLLQPSSTAPSSSSEMTSSSGLQYSGPIFTPEFMAYNKTRDSYRRNLAMERSNCEHELEALRDFDMDVRIQKQMERVRNVDEKIEQTMEQMRHFFGGVPAAKDHLISIDSLTDWLQSITRLGQSNQTKKTVKEAINKHAKAIINVRKI